MSDSSSASPEFYPSASVTMAASFTPPPWRNQFYPSGPSRPDPHHNNLPSSLSYRSPTSVCHSITGPAPPVLIQFYNREAEQLKKKKNTAITPPKITERRKSSLALLPPLLTSHFSEYQSHSSQPTSELWGKVPEQKPRETSTILFGGKNRVLLEPFYHTPSHTLSVVKCCTWEQAALWGAVLEGWFHIQHWFTFLHCHFQRHYCAIPAAH